MPVTSVPPPGFQMQSSVVQQQRFPGPIYSQQPGVRGPVYSTAPPHMQQVPTQMYPGQMSVAPPQVPHQMTSVPPQTYSVTAPPQVTPVRPPGPSQPPRMYMPPTSTNVVAPPTQQSMYQHRPAFISHQRVVTPVTQPTAPNVVNRVPMPGMRAPVGVTQPPPRLPTPTG